MKRTKKTLIGISAVLIMLIVLLAIPSVQDFAYAKTMDALTEDCTVTISTTITGTNVLVGCVGNDGTCKKETKTVTGPRDVILERN